MRRQSAASLHKWDEIQLEPVSQRIDRRFVSGEKLMVGQVFLKKGALARRHSHENEQLTYVLEGALEFRLGIDSDRAIVVRSGEILHVPSDLPHEVVALDDTFLVDIFSPPRRDWIEKTDDYLRD